MSAFGDQIAGFTRRVETKSKAVFVGVATEVQRSVVNGSPLTGAAGQPVDTGRLKASFIGEFKSATEWELTTDVPYAPAIEDGVGQFGPLTLRSETGGFHSVKLTAANFDRIVEHVVAQQEPS